MAERKSYDPECEKLAEYFLMAECGHDLMVDGPTLAQDIQDAVESWFAERRESRNG